MWESPPGKGFLLCFSQAQKWSTSLLLKFNHMVTSKSRRLENASWKKSRQILVHDSFCQNKCKYSLRTGNGLHGLSLYALGLAQHLTYSRQSVFVEGIPCLTRSSQGLAVGLAVGLLFPWFTLTFIIYLNTYGTERGLYLVLFLYQGNVHTVLS